jgi:hypothetical protein
MMTETKLRLQNVLPKLALEFGNETFVLRTSPMGFLRSM